jgi:hypothetical protein
MAEEMGLDRSWAINRRSQFLTNELMATDDGFKELADFVEDHEATELSLYLLADEALALVEKKAGAIDEIARIKKMTKDPKEMITDEMVEAARRYPIERLIEFRHKKALAWCHEDRHPSLCHMDKTNRAWCPVCDRYFDGIAVLMDRGYSFKEAVIALN